MSDAMKSSKLPLRWIGIFVIGAMLCACASKREAAPVVMPTGPQRAGAGSALCYFYRTQKRLGWSAPYPIRDGGTQIGGLRAGEYFSFEAAPGLHEFSAGANGSQKRSIELEARQTYYLRVDEEDQFYITPPHLTLVDPAQAPSVIAQLKRVAASGQ